MRATDVNGAPTPIEKCYIQIPGSKLRNSRLTPRIIPEFGDSKSASYTDDVIPGRSSGLKIFSHSDSRAFSVRWHFIIVDDETLTEAVNGLNAIRSCVYPYTTAQGFAPYGPPAICVLSCGQVFNTGKTESICAVLKRYSVSFPTDVAWDEDVLIPYRFSVDMDWEAVFATSNLPGRERIIE